MSAIDLTTITTAVLVNTKSGSYTPDAVSRILAALSEAKVPAPRVWAAEPADVDQAFEEIAEHAPDLLIVLGGDGTIRSAAESCLDTKTMLVPLPGGTMNMLPKALYGTRTWEEALKDTLGQPFVRSISSGCVSGRQFYIAAIVGTPTLWTHAREALREGDMQGALDKGVHAFQNMLASKVSYRFSEEESGEADALAVICPLISQEMNDDERALEAAVIDVNTIAGVLDLASSAAFGAWRENANVTVTKTLTVTIKADQDIPLILDGESMDLGKEVEITFVPEAFIALVPSE
ncbi:MAG: diacylglycerol kinase family protein [Patescibacteria group bacterium]